MIPVEVKEKCIALKAEGMAVREIYSDYFLANTDSTAKFESFQRKLNQWVTKYGGDVPVLPNGFVPTRGTYRFGGDGKVDMSWVHGVKPELDFKAEFLAAVREHDPIDCIIKFDPVIIKSNLLEIPLFDMHFGVANFKHYEGHLREIIGHIRKGFEHIVITVGSDLLHHNDMRSQTAGGTAIEQLNIRTAYGDAFKFYVTLIKEAVENAKEVTVIYIKGNHDESPSYWLADKLSYAFPTVKFDLGYKERKAFIWKNIFIGYIHGDKPTNDIDRVFTREYRKEFAVAEIVEIHVGHTHKENAKGNTQDKQGVMVRVLSTSAKTDEWHDDNNYVGANKRFQLFEYSSDELINAPYISGK